MADQFQRCAKHGIRYPTGAACPACEALARALSGAAETRPTPRLVAAGTGRVIHKDGRVTEFTFEGEV